MRVIEVTFPVDVEMTGEFQQQLLDLVDTVCNAYEATHPGRVMWPAGVGFKIVYLPLTREEEEERGIEFDDSTLSIECFERERYHRWHQPSAGAGGPQCRDCEMPRRDDTEYTACMGPVR